MIPSNPHLPTKFEPVEPHHSIPPAPVHPMAAMATILLDNIFGVLEIIDPLLILLTSLTVFMIGTLTVMFIQRFIAGDDWGPAAAKGLVLGVVAGIPFPVTGTAAGISLLGWAGLHRWIKPVIG